MNWRRPNSRLVERPDSQDVVSEIAERTLRAAGAVGKLPTPIDDLIRAAKVVEEEDSPSVVERFASLLNEKRRSLFKSAFQKIRGIADLRERVVYVPSKDKPPRVRFAKAHELGHQVITWHHVNSDEMMPFHQDDNKSLSPEVERLFDFEANFFASEVIFQGRRFTTKVRDFQPSFDAVFLLSEMHGASKQATLRLYVEEHDEALASVEYLPCKFVLDASGLPILRTPRIITSVSFRQKIGEVQVPPSLAADHVWGEARKLSQVCDGEITLTATQGSVRLQWQAWWNCYALMVLLRRKPSLSVVRSLLTPVK